MPQIASPKIKSKRAAFASSVGNVLEWYDFAIYAFLASTIGRLFFPRSDDIDSLLITFGVFAAGHLMRPLGGVLFGHIGDRHGRKPVLVLSMVAMGLCTVAIGLLPTVAQAGPIAAILLIVFRMLQGLSLGGEYTGSVCYCAECATDSRRGLLCTASIVGAGLGALLGSAVANALFAALPPGAMEAWGWRIPFLLGGVISIIGLYIRRDLPDTLVDDPEHARPSLPVIQAITRHMPDILRVVGINLMHAVAFFMVFVFMKTYLSKFAGLTETEALTITTLGLMALMAVTVAAGALSDHVGRKRILRASALSAIVLALPLYYLISLESFWITLGCQFVFALIVGAYCGTAPSTMTEIVPGHLRVTCTSLGYNLSMALFGGTTPMIALLLIKETGSTLVPALYVVAAAAVSLIVLFVIPETSQRPLARWGKQTSPQAAARR